MQARAEGLPSPSELAAWLEAVPAGMAARLSAFPPAAPAAASGARRLARDHRGRPVLEAAAGPAKPAFWNRPLGRSAERPLYAVGDVHGCYGLLVGLVGQIAADAQEAGPGLAPTVVFLGDYLDRGPDSAAVLEALVWLRGWGGFDLHLLKGNHEQGLLRFLDDPPGGEPWVRFGGAATLRSYGVEPPAADAPPADWFAARDGLLRRMPAAHLRLLQSLELMIVVAEHAFVHAGVDPDRPLLRQAENDLLWIREPFLTETRRFEKVIVHGHTWIDDQPVLHQHRIGVDSGAYATGVLTAVRLSGGKAHVLQAREPGREPWPRSPARAEDGRRLVARPADYAAGVGDLTLRLPPAPPVATPIEARGLYIQPVD